MTKPTRHDIEYWRLREQRLIGLLDRAFTPTETRLVNEAIADVRALIAKRFQTPSEVVRPS